MHYLIVANLLNGL